MKPSPSVPSRDFAASLELVAEPIVRAALLEDIGRGGDLTTEAIVEPNRDGDAHGSSRVERHHRRRRRRRARVSLARRTHASADVAIGDGERVEAGGVVAEIAGSARAILTAERTALNLLCQLVRNRDRDARARGARRRQRARRSPIRARRRPVCARSSATPCLRGRNESPFRPRRRRPDQRQPSRAGRLDPRGGRRRARPRRAHGEDRSRSRHARAAARGARRTDRRGAARQHGRRRRWPRRLRIVDGRVVTEASGGVNAGERRRDRAHRRRRDQRRLADAQRARTRLRPWKCLARRS